MLRLSCPQNSLAPPSSHSEHRSGLMERLDKEIMESKRMTFNHCKLSCWIWMNWLLLLERNKEFYYITKAMKLIQYWSEIWKCSIFADLLSDKASIQHRLTIYLVCVACNACCPYFLTYYELGASFLDQNLLSIWIFEFKMKDQNPPSHY